MPALIPMFRACDNVQLDGSIHEMTMLQELVYDLPEFRAGDKFEGRHVPIKWIGRTVVGVYDMLAHSTSQRGMREVKKVQAVI
jgi:hypothetical protein